MTSSTSTSAAPAAAPGSLQQGTLGWASVAALGIAIAISGNFSGWNFGLGLGGLGGMLVAALGMALFFFGLTQCVAEIATVLSDEAGFDGYARRLLGPSAGFVCGMAVAVALAGGSGLILSFIDAYASAAFGVGGWGVRLAVMAAVLLLQVRGASDAVFTTMVVGAVALAVLLAYCGFNAPVFELAHWRHVAVEAGPGGQGWAMYFPHGAMGVLKCVPFAVFLFLGVEQATLAAPEMKDMRRALPKALIAAITVVVGIALTVLVVSTGAAGIDKLAPSEDPLLTVLGEHAGRAGADLMTTVVGIGALCALLSTFFSLVYASSRQFYHLAAAGDLPGMLGKANRRGAPTAALALVAVLGGIASAFPPDDVLVVLMFLMSVGYVHVVASFLRLRGGAVPAAASAAAYRAIGGVPLALLTGLLALVIAASCWFLQGQVLSALAVAIVLLYGYAHFVRRRGAAASA